MNKELSLKNIEKIGRFLKLDFRALPRFGAFWAIETWDSIGIKFSPLSIIRENLKKISRVVSEIISAQNDTLKIRKSSIFRTGSDVTTQKIIFGQARPIYTIPENFMKIRPGVLEKSSKKKKKN